MQEVGVVIFAAVVLVLLQTSVVPLVPILPVVPDLLLVLTVWVGLRHHGVGGAVAAVALGYVLDTFSGTTLGLHMFALTAAYISAYVLARTHLQAQSSERIGLHHESLWASDHHLLAVEFGTP